MAQTEQDRMDAKRRALLGAQPQTGVSQEQQRQQLAPSVMPAVPVRQEMIRAVTESERRAELVCSNTMSHFLRIKPEVGSEMRRLDSELYRALGPERGTA
ncbi:MAG: hypothetical protein U0R44_06100 [Candidatus Micrarchaeia archaeon]